MTMVRDWQAPTAAAFQADILPAAKPAVLRAVAADWPVVRQAAEGHAALVRRLTNQAADVAIDVVRADPAIEGRFHYAEDMRGMNFVKGRTNLAVFLAALMEQANEAAPFAMAAQGIHAETVLPGFDAAHPMPFVPAGAEASSRLWIGNAAKVATHNDPSDNIAVVAAGRRRFTLFPPDQLPNLYLGPLHNTPAGTPVSMVHLTKPDFARFPRFPAALEQAQVAELAPGDAIFIPYGWFHHVEALDPVLNILVNYWWNAADMRWGSPWDTLLHGIMSLRDLPPAQRDLWRAMFDHYVFQVNEDPVAHLPADMAGVLGPVDEQQRRAMAQALARALTEITHQ